MHVLNKFMKIYGGGGGGGGANVKGILPRHFGSYCGDIAQMQLFLKEEIKCNKTIIF